MTELSTDTPATDGAKPDVPVPPPTSTDSADSPAATERPRSSPFRQIKRLTSPHWLLPAAVVGAVVALPLYGMWIAPGPPMEEGFMVVFPERVLAGDVPNRDFLHLYGPGSLWVLAGAFKIFGTDLWVERLVGLGQILGLVAGVTYVSYRWGRWPAIVGGGCTAVVIMPAIGLTALAWVGGLALGLWAVIVAARALDGPPCAHDIGDDCTDRLLRRRRNSLLLGGLLAGLALLYRPDLVVALGLPLGLMGIWGLDWSGRRWLLGGCLAGASPYVLHFALAGPGDAFSGMVLEPVFDLRGGRSLGFPPSWNSYDSFLNQAFHLRDWPWPLPTPYGPNQVFLWVPLLFAACAVLVLVGVQARRSGSAEGWRVLALALFAVGTLPQAVQRPDTAHLAWVSAVPFGLWPLAMAEWFRMRRPATSSVGASRSRALNSEGDAASEGPIRRLADLAAKRLATPGAAALIPVMAFFVVIPNFTVVWYSDYVGQTVGYEREGNVIEHRGRTFYHGREGAVVAAREMLQDIEQVTGPGDTLIVGTGNFDQAESGDEVPRYFELTAYSEVQFYFLLPQLEVGTHYIEMDPGVANAEDSGLAGELREADVVIISTLYDDWDEPNDARKPGSTEPAEVMAEDFCLQGSYGQNPRFDEEPDEADRPYYELHVRC